MWYYFVIYILSFLFNSGICIASGYILVCLYDYDEHQLGSIQASNSINQALPFEYILLILEFIILLFCGDYWIYIFVLPPVIYLIYKYLTNNLWVKQEELYQKSTYLKIETFIKIGVCCLCMFCFFFCFVRDLIYLAQNYTK